MYIALEHFTDMQDNNFKYNPGDKFPRTGLEVSEERLKELSSNENRRGKAMIKLVKEEKPEKPVAEIMPEPVKVPEVMDEPKPVREEKKEPVKPKRGRKKKDA
jgi:hypothetical protein